METNDGATEQDERAQREHREDDRREPAFQPVREQIDKIMLEVGEGKTGTDLPDDDRVSQQARANTARWAAPSFWLRLVGVASATGAAVTVWKFVLP